MQTANTPAAGLFILKLDAPSYTPTSVTWMDDYTLRLVKTSTGSLGQKVMCSYSGPNSNLATIWGKIIEPWALFPCVDIN